MDDDYKIKPFSIILPKKSAYVKIYGDEPKWIHFLIEDDESKMYNDIWNKDSNSTKKEFDSQLIYNKKILKSYSDKEMSFMIKKWLK